MNEQQDRLIIYPTKRPHTFFLKYRIGPPSKPYIEECENYKIQAQRLVNEVNLMGLRANLITRYKWNPNYYITFKRKYDVVAFKLKWVL